TSLPVPAVVGRVMIGGRPAGTWRPPSILSSSSSNESEQRARSAISLPASIGEPPPRLITPSAWCAFSAAAPASMLASVGFGSTPSKTCAAIPACSSERVMSAASPALTTPVSVTKSALVTPIARASSPVRLRSPAPKTMRVGKLQTAVMVSISRFRSDGFEVTGELPIGHCPFVAPALPVASAHVMIDEIRAEDLGGAGAFGEPGGGVTQGSRERERTRFARIPFCLGRRLGALLDDPAPGTETGGHRNVGIHVGCGLPVL